MTQRTKRLCINLPRRHHRRPLQLREGGVHTELLYKHPLTDLGLAKFTDDWQKANLNFD
ncbi:hypothetical protein [Armatimonas sp.]|uniref:hypothetical protein n=1 Tax=Armatimonas sp. TaxID=1872638 RepID=UPI0037535F9B